MNGHNVRDAFSETDHKNSLVSPWLMLPVVALCSSCTPPLVDGWQEGPDFRALCPEWSHDCDDGCADIELESRYEEAYLAWWQEKSAWTDAQMGDHFQLLEVETWEAQYTSHTEIRYAMRTGWVWVATEAGHVAAPGGQPSVEEITTELENNDWPLMQMRTSRLVAVTWQEAQQWVSDCEAELGVEFPEIGDSGVELGWCRGNVPDQRGDVPEEIAFEFFTYTDDIYVNYAYGRIDVEDTSESRCELGQEIRDR